MVGVVNAAGLLRIQFSFQVERSVPSGTSARMMYGATCEEYPGTLMYWRSGGSSSPPVRHRHEKHETADRALSKYPPSAVGIVPRDSLNVACRARDTHASVTPLAVAATSRIRDYCGPAPFMVGLGVLGGGGFCHLAT